MGTVTRNVRDWFSKDHRSNHTKPHFQNTSSSAPELPTANFQLAGTTSESPKQPQRARSTLFSPDDNKTSNLYGRDVHEKHYCRHNGCPKRGRGFKRKSDRNRHKKEHTAKVACRNPQCESTFARASNMERHFQSCHQQPEILFAASSSPSREAGLGVPSHSRILRGYYVSYHKSSLRLRRSDPQQDASPIEIPRIRY